MLNWKDWIRSIPRGLDATARVHNCSRWSLGRPAEDQVAVLEFRAQAAELREATQGLLLVEEAIRRRLLEQTHDRSQTERLAV
jgi:hypothetical protein